MATAISQTRLDLIARSTLTSAVESVKPDTSGFRSETASSSVQRQGSADIFDATADDDEDEDEPSEKSKKPKKKKGKKSKKKQLYNSKGEKVTAREYTLSTTLDAAKKALDDHIQRVKELVATNVGLQETCERQEKDGMDVIAAARDETDGRVADLHAFEKEMDDERAIFCQEKERLIEEYEQKLEDLSELALEKDASIQTMHNEISVMKDFRRMREDMIKDLEILKAEMATAKKMQQAQVVNMERRFFEEKVRLQKEANRKISELAAQAHKEALAKIDDHTRSVFKENVRMIEALSLHVDDGKQLHTISETLSKQNKKLQGETTAHAKIITDKIVTTQHQSSEIKDLKAKILGMEYSLEHVVRQFEKERNVIAKIVRREIDDVRQVTAHLKHNLDRKTQEMKHIFLLAQNVLDLRTELEVMFMEALESVRESIRLERDHERQEAKREYRDKMDTVIRMHPVNHFNAAGSKKSDAAKSSLESLLCPPDFMQNTTNNRIEVSDMTWEQKEEVLCLLFAKINASA